MGTYEPRKAQGALALAFAEVADDAPDTVFAFVGDTGGPYADAVHDVVDRLELGDRIRLVPVVSDIYVWYLMADALVSVSDVESLPRSVLEAMAFEVPVLAASVFGLPELIEDGVNGLLCAPCDIGALVGGLRRLLSLSPEERARLGARQPRSFGSGTTRPSTPACTARCCAACSTRRPRRHAMC